MLPADKDLKPAPKAAYGSWDAAQQFYPSVQAGHAALIDQHSRFLHAVMDIVKKLHGTARAYDEAEAELERRIAAVDRRLNAATTSNLYQLGPASAPPPPPRNVSNALNPEGRD
jgi:hypothetical protein